MPGIVAAVIQLSSGTDKDRNLGRARDLIREAHATSGASLVVLPEVFLWRGPPRGEREAAETIPGPATRQMGDLARELGIHLLLGSMLEKSPSETRPFNTSVFIAPDGVIQATYRKIHLFDVDVDGVGSIRESATRAPGDRAVLASLAIPGSRVAVPLGLSICYDLRFPELYRHLAVQGARILAVPSAFTARTGRDHWLALLKARAIENLAYVVAANQFGSGGEGIDTYGRSAIIDPWGTVLALCPDGEGWASAVLDLERQETIRRGFPALRHMRMDLFLKAAPIEKKGGTSPVPRPERASRALKPVRGRPAPRSR